LNFKEPRDDEFSTRVFTAEETYPTFAGLSLVRSLTVTFHSAFGSVSCTGAANDNVLENRGRTCKLFFENFCGGARLMDSMRVL
jgi:hypothetical protein